MNPLIRDRCNVRGGSKDSDVLYQALGAQLVVCPPCGLGFVGGWLAPEERTGPRDVGGQTLIRGLLAAFPFFRLGLSLSKLGRPSRDWLHSAIESSPAVVPPSLPHDSCHAEPATTASASMTGASPSDGRTTAPKAATAGRLRPEPRVLLARFSSVACQFSFGDLPILTGPSRHADIYGLA